MVKSVITSFRWTVNGKAGRPALGAHVARAWGSPLSPGDIGRARPLIRGPRCPRREVGGARDVKVPVPRGGRGNTWEAPKRGLAPGAARRGAGAPETAGLRDVWGRRVGVRGLYRGVWGSGRGALWGDRRTARVPTGPPGPACRPRGARGPGSVCPDVDTAAAETGRPSAFGGRCLDAHCLNEFP